MPKSWVIRVFKRFLRDNHWQFQIAPYYYDFVPDAGAVYYLKNTRQR